MTVQLGQIAPDFEADSTAGRIRFHEWLGDRWGLLFSHPKDFTPVCTTELGAVAKLAPELARRGVKPIGLSVDPVSDHERWVGDIEETQGAAVHYPLLADPDRVVANLYGMIHPEADPKLTVRAVFVIGADKRIKASILYPPSTGRNFAEVLRLIDSLQLTEAHGVATPVDWRPGEDVIIPPSVSDAEARTRFPEGFETIKPYLRVTRAPR